MPSNTSGPTSGATSNTPDPTPVEPTKPQTEEQDKPKGSPYDLVRVKSNTSGNEHTVTRVMAEKNDDLKVIGKPAVSRANGKPLAARPKPKNRTDKAGAPVQEA